MFRTTTLLSTLLAATLILTGCGKKSESPKKEQTGQEQNRSAEQQAPSTITLHTTGGEDIVLTATPKGIIFGGYEGKAVLLDFFATWCPPCRAELPHLADIQSAYKGKVQIIGILMEENKDDLEVQQFEKEMRINFPVANSPANFDLSAALGGIRSLPTMVLYDTRGDYFTHYVGAAPQEMIEADIQRALNRK